MMSSTAGHAFHVGTLPPPFGASVGFPVTGSCTNHSACVYQSGSVLTIGPGLEALSAFSQGWFATNRIFLVSTGGIAPYVGLVPVMDLCNRYSASSGISAIGGGGGRLARYERMSARSASLTTVAGNAGMPAAKLQPGVPLRTQAKNASSGSVPGASRRAAPPWPTVPWHAWQPNVR